jgi:hypothetical protein
MTQNADSKWQADDIARAYWTVMGARDWPALTALLADDVLYELPQSRERVRGAEALVRFSAEYPGTGRSRSSGSSARAGPRRPGSTSGWTVRPSLG